MGVWGVGGGEWGVGRMTTLLVEDGDDEMDMTICVYCFRLDVPSDSCSLAMSLL